MKFERDKVRMLENNSREAQNHIVLEVKKRFKEFSIFFIIRFCSQKWGVVSKVVVTFEGILKFLRNLKY